MQRQILNAEQLKNDINLVSSKKLFLNRVQASIHSALAIIKSDTSFAGQNGPYCEKESQLRNFAHLMVAIGLYPEINNNEELQKEYLFIFNRYASMLRLFLAGKLRLRDSNKDKYNGIMSTSFALEPLFECTSLHDKLNLSSKVQDLINLAKHAIVFDDSQSLWKLSFCDQIDRTFNHQLWMAMVSQRLFESHNTDKFLDLYLPKLSFYFDGILRHSQPCMMNLNHRHSARSMLYEIKYFKKLRKKSIGYHSFNLFAASRLYLSHSNPPRSLLGFIQRLTKPLFSDKYYSELISNPYSYSYNTPSSELAIQLISVGSYRRLNSLCKQQEIMDKIFSHHNGHIDLNTHLARSYESAIAFQFMAKIV